MQKQECLYQVLGVEKDASSGDIRTRYRQLALQLHPDKNPTNVQEASDKFQALQKVWAILGDPEKRKVYDDTGLCDEDGLQGSDFSNLKEYFAAMFAPVTPAAIDSFALTYRGSEEESQDLLAYYSEASGDMHVVFTNIMCSEPDIDSHRFMDVILEAQAQGSVKKFKRFTTWAAQTQARPRVQHPLKPRKSTSSSSSALVAAIQSRAGCSDAAFDALALKYAPKEKAKRGAGKGSAQAKTSAGPPGGEPSEAEWAAASARMAARASQSKPNSESSLSQPQTASKRQKPAERGKATSRHTDTEGLQNVQKHQEQKQSEGVVKKGKQTGQEVKADRATAEVLNSGARESTAGKRTRTRK